MVIFVLFQCDKKCVEGKEWSVFRFRSVFARDSTCAAPIHPTTK
jgi:hypothetical protein